MLQGMYIYYQYIHLASHWGYRSVADLLCYLVSSKERNMGNSVFYKYIVFPSFFFILPCTLKEVSLRTILIKARTYLKSRSRLAHLTKINQKRIMIISCYSDQCHCWAEDVVALLTDDQLNYIILRMVLVTIEFKQGWWGMRPQGLPWLRTEYTHRWWLSLHYFETSA